MEEPVWLATLRPLSSLDLGDVEVLARHDLRGLADIFDQGDGDEAALVVADDEGRPGIGAHVHLPRHHLLHGEIAGRHREFLELDAAFLQQAGLEQVVGRHPPDVGLVALADGFQRERRTARLRGPAASMPALPARYCRRVMMVIDVSSVVLVRSALSSPLIARGAESLLLLHAELADAGRDVVQRLRDHLPQLRAASTTPESIRRSRSACGIRACRRSPRYGVAADR